MRFLPLFCVALGALICVAPCVFAAPSKSRPIPKIAPRRAPAPQFGDWKRQQLQAKLRVLKAQRLKLLHEWTPGSSQIRAVERAIAQLQKELHSLSPSRPLPSTTEPYLHFVRV